MKRGFTLIEILIVVAIIGLLIAIAIPQILLVHYKDLRDRGECTEDCMKFLAEHPDDKDKTPPTSTVAIPFQIPTQVVVNTPSTSCIELEGYDKGDVEVFCKLYKVNLGDFCASKSLQGYYGKFKDGSLELKVKDE